MRFCLTFSLGTKVIGSLLTDTPASHSLHTLFLVRNTIQDEGAQSLAHALSLNSRLKLLDIRLNHITDLGSIPLAQALLKNETLVGLNLAANRITQDSCHSFSEMLVQNKTLIELDLSSNDLGLKGKLDFNIHNV